VVLATDRHLGREVAMKELLAQARNAEAAVSVGAVTRFLREARITGQLEHPSIVPVHELGQREDGTLYYTMKRIRGRSLASALRDAQNLTDRLKLLGHFRDVCEAIAYAHSRGVVHRDLKPENVILTGANSTETARVLDYGLAGIIDGLEDGQYLSVTRGGQVIGTLQYMAPEQLTQSEIARPQSDVFAIGIIGLECLQGAPAIPGSTPFERAAWLNGPEPVAFPTEIGSGPLGPLIARACDKDWTMRYASATEMLEALVAPTETSPKAPEQRPRSGVMSRLWRGFIDKVRPD
jgi:serine/threonine-protein kinase